jgi:hypothetical protein
LYVLPKHPRIPLARLHRDAAGLRPELERALNALKRCAYPAAIGLLAVVGTLGLFYASAWLLSNAVGAGPMPPIE